MSARRKARKRAIDILFGADVRETSLADALESARAVASAEPERASSWPYAQQIVEGILAHLPEIDTAIRAASTSWPLERMPAVDRAVLRLGAWSFSTTTRCRPPWQSRSRWSWSRSFRPKPPEVLCTVFSARLGKTPGLARPCRASEVCWSYNLL